MRSRRVVPLEQVHVSQIKVELRMPPLSALTISSARPRRGCRRNRSKRRRLRRGGLGLRCRPKCGARGLGRLSNAIGNGGDRGKRGAVRSSGPGWSASGWVHVRSKPDRMAGRSRLIQPGPRSRLAVVAGFGFRQMTFPFGSASGASRLRIIRGWGWQPRSGR